MLAHELERIVTCPDCHTRREEWDEKHGGDRHAYYAEAFICPGCAEKEAKANAEAVNNDGKMPDGLKVGMVTKEQRQADIAKRARAKDNGKM